jgi:hypothetical protein
LPRERAHAFDAQPDDDIAAETDEVIAAFAMKCLT